MTKPTGVREIIDGIETKQWWVDDLEQKQCGPWSTVEELRWPDTEKVFHAVEKAAFDKVVAIALELERQRNSHIKCWMSDDRQSVGGRMNPDNPNFRTPEEESRAEEYAKLKAENERLRNAFYEVTSFVDCMCLGDEKCWACTEINKIRKTIEDDKANQSEEK